MLQKQLKNLDLLVCDNKTVKRPTNYLKNIFLNTLLHTKFFEPTKKFSKKKPESHPLRQKNPFISGVIMHKALINIHFNVK